MSLLFSELNRSDAVCENFTNEQSSNSNYTYSPTHSFPSESPGRPSRRAMLRQLNRTFKQQLSEVDECLRGASQKYGEMKLMRTCESALMPKYHTSCLSATQEQFDRQLAPEQDLWEQQEQEYSSKTSYQQVINEQQHLQAQLQAISKLLGKRTTFTSAALQKAQQLGPINWQLLIGQQNERTHRELFKTSLWQPESEKQCKSRQREDYIAYTEQPSVHELMAQQRKREYVEDSTIGEGNRDKGGRNGVVKESSKGKLNRGIETRIISSPCTIGKILHPNSASETKQLLNRLTKEKNQREQLLASIKFSLM